MFPFEPLEVYSLFDSVLPATTGIYAIVNILNGKYYIGSARANGKNPSKKGFRIRFDNGTTGHRSLLRNKNHHCKYLQHSYNHYVDNLSLNPNDVYQIWILEYVERSECLKREQWYFDEYEPEYNGTLLAKGGRDRPHTEEAKRKISISNKGKTFSLSSRQKMSEAQKQRGKPSEKTRKLMSESQKRRPPKSKETREKLSEVNTINIAGQTFDRLTVMHKEKINSDKKAVWACKCSCGNPNLVFVTGVALRSGKTKSCGCWNKEINKQKMTTHGKSKSSEYKIWKRIRQYCYNENDVNYKNVGGKGVSLCQEWLESFENFYEDMGKKPGKDYVFSRLDENDDYKKDNCRWVSRIEAYNNTKKSVYLTYGNETRTIAEWVRYLNVDYMEFYNKIKNNKEDFENIVDSYKKLT